MADAGAAEEKHGQDAQEEEDWKIQAEAFKNEGLVPPYCTTQRQQGMQSRVYAYLHRIKIMVD